MSGIVGIYYLDGRPVERTDLGHMVDTLVHRGPDGSAIWSEGSVGFGHRMLWTTSESLHERLPFTDTSGNFTITADARIDNRDELLSALSITSRWSSQVTDSEIILAAYEKWGERCVERLLGDFAFAIWDQRRRTLFCARDHFGVKPFYYYRSRCAFVFASEIRALFCLPEIPKQLNEVQIAEFLLHTHEDATSTLYQEIVRLSPAHSLIITQEDVVQQCYWALDPTREIRFHSDTEYAEAFRDIFTEAVRCRMRSNGPIGSALSGGLDSSSIVCVARMLFAQQVPLHTFSAVYDEVTSCDERDYINAVLAQGGMIPHYGHPDHFGPLTNWIPTSWRTDEPLWNAQMAVHWSLYQEAQKHQIHVFLDGFAGDFVISFGIGYLAELARAGRWVRFLCEANGLRHHLNSSTLDLVWRRGVRPLTPHWLLHIWRMVRRRGRSGGMPEWVSGMPLHADFLRRPAIDQLIADVGRASYETFRSERYEHYEGMVDSFQSFTLGMADRAAATFGIERRHPFLDRRVAEFCLSLPASQKLSRGWPRMIVRRALVDILPDTVRWRVGKADMSPNFERGLLEKDHALLKDLIFNNTKSIEQYVDIPAIHCLYHRYVDHPILNDGSTLWRVAMLARWLQ